MGKTFPYITVLTPVFAKSFNTVLPSSITNTATDKFMQSDVLCSLSKEKESILLRGRHCAYFAFLGH